ncbi:MAG: RIP metalloprotease [Candidatus Paceibacterota bacterium]
MSATAIFLFFIILLALVIVHEFGHFIAAKWVGMRVDEFAFGFPPRLFSKKKGETVYAVNALPLGGYVSIWGENGEPDDIAKTHPRAFGNRPKWAQLLVLFAGVAMNMLLALIIFIGVSYGKVQMSADDPTYGDRVNNAYIMVMSSAPDSPAQRVGLTPGSVIIKLTSAGVTADIRTATSAVAFVERHQNDSFAITFIKPNGETVSTTIAPVYGIVPSKKALGLSLETVGYVHTSMWEAMKIGVQRTYDTTIMTFDGLWTLLRSIGGGQNVLDSLAGPIGIAKIVGEQSSYGFAAVLTLVAILSVNLAVFNILPLPALDGGRIVVVVIEAVIRRKIPYKYYAWVNVVGFVALMALLLVVTVHDIWG